MPESITIDKLWMGTSGQAPWQRKQGTVKTGKNVRFDVRIGGAVKRSATEYVCELVAHAQSNFDPDDNFLWTNIRGTIIAIGKGGRTSSDVVLGWDEYGVPLQVIDENGLDVPGSLFDTYLSNIDDPIAELDVAGKYDTLIVANRAEGLSGAGERAYTFDQSYSYVAGGAPDATGFNASWAPGNTVDVLSDLDELPSPTDGLIYHVLFDENLDPAGFYMYYDSAEHSSYENGFFPEHGSWYRVPDGRGSGQKTGAFDSSRMPHKIVYHEANGTLTISPIAWRQRVSGTTSTVPRVPWLKALSHVQSIEFFAGRLFIISEEHVTASRNGDYFNLWVDNVNAVTDQDRIIQSVTQTEMGKLLRMAAVGRGILVTAEHGQLEFSSGQDTLTNLNGRINTVTDFPSADISPAVSGSQAAIFDAYGDAHLYAWEQADLGPSLMYASLLTAHEPNLFTDYAVKGVSLQHLTLFAWTADVNESNLTEADTAKTMVHESFVVQGAMVQSAWSTLEIIDEPVFMHAWGNAVRIVTKQTDSDGGYTLLAYQHRQPRIPSGMLYQPRMDRLELVPASDIVYDEDADETTIPHAGRIGDADRSFAVIASEPNRHEFVKADHIDANGDPVFQGNLGDADSTEAATQDQYLGFMFDYEIALFELYPAITSQGVQTEVLAVFHFETTDYKLEFQPYLNSKVFTESFQSHRVGVATVGQPSHETSWKEMGVNGDPRDMQITIKSSTPGQTAIMAIEYVLHQQARGKR